MAKRKRRSKASRKNKQQRQVGLASRVESHINITCEDGIVGDVMVGGRLRRVGFKPLYRMLGVEK